MSWRPSLVALDIDGTLLGFDGVMPPRVHRAVRKVVDAGVPVVLSTGRGWRSVQPVHERLGLPSGPVVCSNGAVIVDYPPFSLLSVSTFDPAPVIRSIIEKAPNVRIAVEVIGEGFRVNRAFPDGELDGISIVESIDQLCAQEVTRVVFRDPYADQADFAALTEGLGMHEVEYSVGYTQWLDIAPSGVNKATALQQVCDRLSIDRAEVLALGDGQNDIEMLSWAGRGVALGDAEPQVREAATDVAARFDDGGTATELERWF